MYLEDNVCKSNKDFEGKCDKVSITGDTCIICSEGYYRNTYSCSSCPKRCRTCVNNDTCLTCSEDYFLTVNRECELKSTITHCKGNVSSFEGCMACEDGYYINNKICDKCDSSCKTCSSSSKCDTCEDNVIYYEGKCIQMSDYPHCTEVEKSTCTKCSFWYRYNEEKQQCEKHVVWWVIVLAVLFILFILAAIIFILVLVTRKVHEIVDIKMKEKKFGIYLLSSNHNVMFIKLPNSNLLGDFEKLNFVSGSECEIPVNSPSSLKFNIGNDTNHHVKIQFVVNDDSERYELKFEPDIIVLPPHYGCQFKATITPICSCTIEDNFSIVSFDLRTNSEVNITVPVEAATVMTTMLDYKELVESK